MPGPNFDPNGSIYTYSSHSNLSNLENNCSQIFVKGPALTKDFFEKIQNDVVPPKTDFFGYTMNTRRFFLLTGLLVLFTFSCIGTMAMWFTDVYKKHINSLLIISEDSPTYDIWRAPSVQMKIKIYIFNYTNIDRFETGQDKKLHVEEVGPYVYFEKLERVNIRFNKIDGTVSFQEKRTYTFSPEFSKGSESDIVIVPNIPMLGAVSMIKQYNFFARMSFSFLLTSLSAKPFIPLTVDQYLNGYEDDLYELGKNYLKFHDMRVFEHFGIFVLKAGIQPDVITLNTGLHNFNKRGQIEKFKGQRSLGLWGSDSCNNVQVSDGMMFPTNELNQKKDLTFFMPHMCRTLKAEFQQESTIFEHIPTYKYKVPLSLFDNVDPDDKCYCTSNNSTCPLRGLFNATKCAFDTPIFYSWPHFYRADPIVKTNFTGIKDNVSMNDTYMDVHPKTGTILSAKFKFQANIELQKSYGIAQLNPYPDSLLAPVVWMEGGLEPEELSSDIVEALYRITFTTRNVELGLKYGTLLATMVTLTCILLVLKKRRDYRIRSNSLRSASVYDD